MPSLQDHETRLRDLELRIIPALEDRVEFFETREATLRQLARTIGWAVACIGGALAGAKLLGVI